jgi:hypothetical protein
MKRTCAIVLMLTSTFAVAAGARGQQAGRGDPDVWRTFVRNLPIGSVVKVRIEGGGRLTAVLFVVDEERRREPIAIAGLDRQHGSDRKLLRVQAPQLRRVGASRLRGRRAHGAVGKGERRYQQERARSFHHVLHST